ncbi:stealth conserved region 3 domain-containing protein [Nocardioides marmotae]|uniref:stealth conserved region 3 domain-containing protein n=1 Tax=Nocardioides marmotae TaxID=2663857 RepID=UPI0012B615E2|nr:stealth conserved region 3 domain-containing protein [Nocardioides marmotae]MBC9734583.1 stealth conserved region 3 domain-containing protein [Nocardioides marmotae]MTB85684.1 glycosyltransferase [Nocardioides marmotae]
MRIAWLVFNLDGMGGTSRSAITQANALAPDHDVRLVSVTRSGDRPHYDVDDRVAVQYLVDVREDRDPTVPPVAGLTPAVATALADRESALVPARWDGQFSALTDVAMEAALPALDVDVLVTVTPALLASAVQLLPDHVTVVHQEHRSSSDRTSGLEPLLTYAPRADVVALLTPTVETWLRERLGEVAPETVVVPNPLPIGFVPRSRLDRKVIVAAGRLVPEKQFPKLVAAFGQVADRLPGWRLRICGEGPQRAEILRQVRKDGLWDRVELPGAVPDMRGEWAKASISALTSRAEGFPLVVQEAMAAGVPVASFDCASGPREIIEHEVSGLLVGPESVAGMAAALLRLAGDEELRHRLGEGAHRAARQYDAHALAERWLGIFADARARRAGRGRLESRALAKPPRRPRAAAAAVDVAEVTPLEARRTALRLAVDAARAASDAWFVVPRDGSNPPTVVVPMAARRALLDHLAAASVPSYLSLRDPAQHGWHERRGSVAELAADLRRGMTTQVSLEPWPTDPRTGRPGLLAGGCGVDVQFWETGVDGDLVAPRRNRWVQTLPAGTRLVDHEVDGVTVRTLPLMAEPTFDECRFPIDVVYTWVDGDDPAWNDARAARLAQVTGTATTREASGRARFVHRDELRHSMRSVHLFAPWVRHIYLVTAGQRPDWLADHPQVTVVDHREILPAEALPTFSSHAIETALHRIPGLSEQWIYLNDDVFLGRPVRPEQLFTPAGQNAVFLSATTVGPDDAPGAPAYLHAAWNNRRLLREAFGVTTTSTLAHTPHPHRVSVLTAISERFAEDVARTARAPFRSEADVSLLSSLAQHYGLATGTAYVGSAEHAFVNVSNSDVEWQLQRLLDREQDFFCLGDHHDHAVTAARLDRLLADFYAEYYPVAAPWER